MKAAEFINDLPFIPKTLDDRWMRELQVLEAVIGNSFLPVVWCPIASSVGAHQVKIWVADDALRIGEPDDYVRVSTTARTAQLICDHLDARMLTPKIVDLVWLQAAVRIEPQYQSASVKNGTMDYSSVMRKHSVDVDRAIAGRTGLIADVGKHWVICSALVKHLGMAANYGWHTEHSKPDPAHPENGPYHAPCGGYMWQTLGMAHNAGTEGKDPGHQDYSQVIRLACRVAEVDGARVPLDDVLTSKELAPAIHYEGALPFTRYPGVPLQPPEGPLEDPA